MTPLPLLCGRHIWRPPFGEQTAAAEISHSVSRRRPLTKVRLSVLLFSRRHVRSVQGGAETEKRGCASHRREIHATSDPRFCSPCDAVAVQSIFADVRRRGHLSVFVNYAHSAGRRTDNVVTFETSLLVIDYLESCVKNFPARFRKWLAEILRNSAVVLRMAHRK